MATPIISRIRAFGGLAAHALLLWAAGHFIGAADSQRSETAAIDEEARA